MTKQASTKKGETEKTDESNVIAYLKANPDMLGSYPDVLTQLTFEHESGAAVSLVERQLKLLREENKGQKKKLNELVRIARENEELGQRFHRLSLELMACNQLHDIVSIAQDQIQTFFYTDSVSFCFHDDLADQLSGLENNLLDAKSQYADKIRGWMKERRPVFGPFDPGLHAQFFTAQLQIVSCVLIPLYHTRDFGLLVLGSKGAGRFNQGMGTVFLGQLGELISTKLKYHLS